MYHESDCKGDASEGERGKQRRSKSRNIFETEREQYYATIACEDIVRAYRKAVAISFK